MEYTVGDLPQPFLVGDLLMNCGGAGGTMGPCPGEGASAHEEIAGHLEATGGLIESKDQLHAMLTAGRPVKIATQDKNRLMKSIESSSGWTMTGKKSGEVATHESGATLHVKEGRSPFGKHHAVSIR